MRRDCAAARRRRVDVRGFDPNIAAPQWVSQRDDDAHAVRDAELVFSLTTGARALEAVRAALPALRPGTLWAEANTATPALKQELAGLVRGVGGVLVDVAIMAPSPRCPMITEYVVATVTPGRNPERASGDNGARIIVGDLVLDEDSHEVTRAGQPVPLAATEFELLRLLMRNPERVLSKARILDRVWGYDFGGRSNIVELYVSYLRKKIDLGREPMIHTVRGAGYVLKPANRVRDRQ